MEDKETKAILASLEGREATDILKSLFVEFTKFRKQSMDSFQEYTRDISLLDKSLNTHKEEYGKYKKELDDEREEVQQTLDHQDKEMRNLSEKLAAATARIQILEGDKAKRELHIESMKSDIVDLKCRSMACNILLHKIPEKDEESRTTLITTVNEIFTSDMKIPTEKANKIVINKIHRLGSKDNRKEDKPRCIVLQVPFESDRQLIFSHAKNLKKDEKYAISGQYPPEISEKRAILKHTMESKEFKEDFKDKKCTLFFDKLYVGNKQHTPGFISSRNAPEFYDPEDVAWDKIPNIYTTRPVTDNGNSFVAYSAAINSKPDAKFIIDMVKGMQSASPANHLVVAYRFAYGNGSSVLEYASDDGEYGVGRNILEKLRSHKKLGTIIIAARWYASHIGARRFKHYLSTAEEAITRLDLGPNYHE